MTQRLRFILDGDDHLSPVLNHAGDSSARLHRRLNDDMDGNSRAVRHFTQDANGRLHDLHGRFVSVADASRLMGDGMPDLTRRLGDVGNASGQTSSALGSSGGGLGGTMLGVAAIAGASLLPAIGALVPMLAGAALAAGTLKLGFDGVGTAVELAGKDHKKYAAALKKMGPEQRDFTKALVAAKKEFGGLGKEVQKAMLPGFTKAVKAAGPVVKILGHAMTEMGGAFGDAAEGVGRLLKDSGFQDSLQTNLKLGTGFIRDMTGALGPFIRSLLDFGAASGPTLKAFSDGISGLLGKGLPDMFTGLQKGIPGAAKMLDGLFSMVNNLLGGLGRLSGEMGKTLGPVFGETFRLLGDIGTGAMDALAGGLDKLQPLFKDLTFGLKTIRDVGTIVGPTFADAGSAIVSAFVPVGDSVGKAVGPLQNLNLWVKNNKVTVLEAAREFGVGMVEITSAAIQAAPVIIKVFKYVSLAVLDVADVVVSAAAKAFGWVPGIGGKLKAANRAFDSFKNSYIGALDAAGRKADQFAASATPKLAAGKLKLDINNWQQQIEAAKAKLKTVPPSKQAALKASIADLEAKVRAAKNQLASVRDKHVAITTTFYSVGSAGSGGIPVAHRNYASGGTPKAGQLAMVGEEGPELVVFGQDARVFDADKTKGILRGNAAPRTLSAGVAAAHGLAAGMTGSVGLVDAAARTMAAGVTTGIKGELEIASPSKKTKALAHDVARGFLEGLTGSQAKIKSASADLVRDIKTAFSGRKESGLVRMVDKDTKKLLDLAAKRDKIAATIVAAKSFASDVTKNAREGASLSNLGMGEGEVTAGGIKAGLASKLAQIKQFTKYVDILAKKGLNKGLLRQILNMGPDAGYAYASALVGADKNTFKSINSLQSQLDKGTTTLGQVGADRLYDSGRNASKGFLKGLLSQEGDLEKAMEKLAKSMQKSLRKALGIKSPATKMIPDGINTARGVAVGVLRGLPHVDRAMQAVAGRMAGRAVMRPTAGRPAVVGAGGTVYNVQVDVHEAMDPVAVGREFQRILLQFGRAQGATVSLKVG
jgi:hypothetical protein